MCSAARAPKERVENITARVNFIFTFFIVRPRRGGLTHTVMYGTREFADLKKQVRRSTDEKQN
jgi:hypothetical protein